MFVQVVDIFDACWHPAYLVMLLSLLSSLNPSFLYFSTFFVRSFPLFLPFFLCSTIPSSPLFVLPFLPLLSSLPPFFVTIFLSFFLYSFVQFFFPFSFLSRRRIRRHCYSSFYKRLRCARNFLLFKKYLVTALIFFKKRKIWN